jgi:pimeloyl-ACP methyl ester carboxylesterase
MTSPKPKVLALHGFTLEGKVMRYQLGPVAEQLEQRFDVSYPDAPHSCSEQSVERLWKTHRPPRGVETPRAWWHAEENGRLYAGWQSSVAFLSPLLAAGEPSVVLGFSQGALLAALLAAISSVGEGPPVAGVILIAGSLPRAEGLSRYFDRVIDVPSLHLIGQRDSLMKGAPKKLVERFDPAQRTVLEFDGGHVVPRRGPAAGAILDFVERYSVDKRGRGSGGLSPSVGPGTVSRGTR